MAYVGAYQELGADIPIQGDASNLAIARVQLAINRVIRGARQDPRTSDGIPIWQVMGNAATPVAISGVAGRFTLDAFKQAMQIAGLSSIGDRVDPSITAALEAFADSRNYPPDEGSAVIVPPASALETKVGAGLPFLPEAGVSVTTVAIAAGVAGAAWFLWKRRS